MTNKKITDLDAASSLDGSEAVETIQAGDNVQTTTQAIADLATIPTELPPSGPAGGDLAGDYPNPTIKADAVTTVKILDGNVTLAKLSTSLQALVAKIPPVLVMESAAPSFAYTRLVQTANDGLIAVGGTAGKWGTFNWDTQIWTQNTFSGAAATAYTWAIYCANVDLIWAGTGSVVHVINPSTKVATAITGTTGALLAAVYNPVAGKVYGFAGSVTALKEMDPTLGTVLRTFTNTAAASGMAAIGVHPVDGRLFVQASNNGSGCWVQEIPYSAFNAVSRLSNFDGGGASPMSGVDNIVVDPVHEVLVLPKASYGYYSVVDFSVAGAMASLSIPSRAVTVGCYQPTTERVYLLGGTLRQNLIQLDPAKKNGFAEALSAVQPANSSHVLNHLAAGSDGNLYALDSTLGSLFRIRP